MESLKTAPMMRQETLQEALGAQLGLRGNSLPEERRVTGPDPDSWDAERRLTDRLQVFEEEGLYLWRCCIGLHPGADGGVALGPFSRCSGARATRNM